MQRDSGRAFVRSKTVGSVRDFPGDLGERSRPACGDDDRANLFRSRTKAIAGDRAEDAGIRKEGTSLEHSLDLLRLHFQAAAKDDRVLDTSRDRKKAVGVEASEISSLQPAVLVNDGARRLLVVQVTLH